MGSQSLLLDLWRDVRYGARLLIRSPGVTIVAVLSLGLGIGANTAMFQAIDALMLTPLPVAKPEELVLLFPIENPPIKSGSIPYPRFTEMRDVKTPFSSFAAIWTIDRSNLIVDDRKGDPGSGNEEGGQVRVGLASFEFFQTLGVSPILGRGFAKEEDQNPGGHPLAVVSYTFWQRRLGGARDAVGRTFHLNGLAYEIIGVTPRGFTGEWVGLPTEVWVPFAMSSQAMPEVPGGPRLFPARVIARLAPGVSRSQAKAAMDLTYRQLLASEAGASPAPERLAQIARTTIDLDAADKGYSPQRTRFAQSFVILMAGVVMLLVVACANLANLLMARSSARRREIAVRLAVGAGRGRLVRQMLIESMLLALTGGAVGLVLAAWASQALAAMFAAAPVSLAGQGSGLVLDLTLGPRAIVFAGVLSAIAGLLFGIAPAMSTRIVPLAPVLRDTGTRTVGRSGMEGPRSVLMIAQVAVSLVLLVGAGLFMRTLRNLESQDLGFERHHELLAWTVPGQTGRQDDAMAAFWQTTMRRIGELPGVVSVGASNQAVLSGALFTGGPPTVAMTVEGEAPKPTSSTGFRSFITPGFFASLGVPLVAGRDFTERDDESAPPVAVINEAMASFYFGDRPAVGRLVRFSPKDPQPTEIVGVVRDYVKGSPRSTAEEFNTYYSYRHKEALNRGAQSRLRIMMIAIRTTADPLTLADRVGRELRDIDPLLPVLRINSVEQQLDDVLAQDRLVAALSSSVGVLALVMASLGLFGLVSYRVARRTNEIGVRMAIGATPIEMLQLILGENMRLVAVGLVVGVLGALALARLVSTRLYGISATDPLTIVGAAALLLIVAAVAALVPARRAAAIDPVSALRCD